MLTQSLRPFSLNDVIGQKGIVKEMKKRSKTMDFPEVMLFEGASGTGKSTLAFIISALLSDKNPIVHEDGTRDPNPESPSSKAILDMKFNRDVIYKDASNMSKDDVIDLQRTVANAPMYDGVKVVIVDECFHKDSLVTTVTGKKKISEIKEGEEVLTDSGFHKVIKVFKNQVPPSRLCLVRTTEGVILTTVDHLFMTPEGWKEASRLESGIPLFNLEVNNGKIISRNLQDMRESFYGKEGCEVLLDSVCKNSNEDSSPRGKDCNRSGWEISSEYGNENYRQKEGRIINIPRVESVEIYQPGSNDESFRSYFTDSELSSLVVPMYDLEVEEVHNYVVNDVLVHNCQELTKAGKGATLTLLEKKRKNVYLILCTMDIDKLDKAVKSRATCYTFKSPSTNDIAELLMNYTDENHCNVPFDEEHKQFFEEGLFLLAENCEGSVRMAVQNFERCVQGEFFKTEEIERELGIISNTKLNELLLKLVNKDTSVIKEIKEFGSKDFYYKMMKILGDSYLFASTGYLDAPWKKGLATRLSSLDLYSIINELQKAELNGYYREDLFLTYLSRAFFDPKMPQGIVRQPSAGVNPSSGRVRVPMQEGIPRREAVVIN